MKMTLSLLTLLGAASAQAAAIQSARINEAQDAIVLDVLSVCENSQLKLYVDDFWAYSMPMQGNAKLVETKFGAKCGQSSIPRQVTFLLKDHRLTGSMLSDARLTIYAEASDVVVQLPHRELKGWQ